MASIIYLVGFMGAGKTVVGRRLAELAGRRFIDLDGEIEKRAGMPVREIFKRWDEVHFRMLEKQALQRASEEKNAIVAVGGGAFCCTENQETITRTGVSVWLDAPLELLFARGSQEAAARPLFASMEAMRQLLESRRPCYAKATVRIGITADMSVDALARQIMQATRLPGMSTEGH